MSSLNIYVQQSIKSHTRYAKHTQLPLYFRNVTFVHCMKGRGRVIIKLGISQLTIFKTIYGLPNNSYKPITNTVWVRARLCKLQKRPCNRLAAASDKVYQLLAHGRWFSPGTPASSTTKTGRHDIAEILLKVALNTKNENQIESIYKITTILSENIICNYLQFSIYSRLRGNMNKIYHDNIRTYITPLQRGQPLSG